MVFNWFRRQYDESSEKSPEPETPPSESPSPTAESNVTETPPDSTDDYLNWAKAAYKNIQQKQKKEEEETPPEITPPTPEILDQKPEILTPEISTETPREEISAETSVISETPREEIAAETPVITETPREEIAAETPVISETPREEMTVETPVISETPREEIAAETPVITETPREEIAAETPVIPETPPQKTETLPLWAKAEADRQARMERLKETAIEEPEPETEALGEMEPWEEFPPLEFDEGFLWSAEILASQGRRPDQISVEEITWLQKLRRGLERTRRSLINRLRAIVGQGPLNQEAVMEIEALLLQADVGVEATDIVIEALQQKLREEVLPPEKAIAYLKQQLRELLDRPYQEKSGGHPAYNLTFAPEKETFNIWLMVGVNGAGKTTTIGKISHLAQKSGYHTLIAAADTFRAAAVEQIKVWGQRSGVDVIANPGQNTDPAAVVFDAISAAQSRQVELLIVDTAGRLQNKKNLMDELSKIRRIIDKKAPDATVESLLVLDATLGQNGLRQAQVFAESAKLSGVVLTKLDGTAKGGVALAVVQQLGLPIRFIGVGETIEDLRPFSSYEFVEALLSSD